MIISVLITEREQEIDTEKNRTKMRQTDRLQIRISTNNAKRNGQIYSKFSIMTHG